MSLFSQLGAPDDLVRGLDALGISSPTSIQASAIPYLIKDGGDLVAQAIQGLNEKAIQIADPYYGRTSVMPWKDFDFRSGFSDPVLHGWYAAVRPKP